MKNLAGKCYILVSALLLALFLPMLFCLIVWGRGMNYYDNVMLDTLLPNYVIFFAAAAVIVMFGAVLYLGRGWKLSAKVNLVLNVLLVLFFIGLYFVNVDLSRELAYYTEWDPGIVRDCAHEFYNGNPLGYNFYLSIYTNNIPITYFLGRLLMLRQKMTNYPYNGEFLWIQMNSLFLSMGGWAACMTVKRQTKNIIAAVASVVFYTIFIGITPWKIIPYTDTYAMAFPAVGICFYVYYRDVENKIAKTVLLILAYLSVCMGGLAKPNVNLVLVAFFVAEAAALPEKWREKWKYALLQVFLATALLIGAKCYTNYMVDEMGLDKNEQISATWHHYLFTGLNEEATGGYRGEDKAMFGEFQDKPRSERNAAELERAWERLRGRGFVGTLHFWLKKMVMTFNDGTLGWGPEGGMDYAFEPIADFDERTEFLRDIFWKGRRFMLKYNTFYQAVWITLLLGIPGLCLAEREKRSQMLVYPVVFVGIFLYLLLFEARARYLLCFAPLLSALGIIGMFNYFELVRRITNEKNRK